MVACIYAPGSWGECLDLTCGRQGGRCQFVEGPRAPELCRCTAARPSPNLALREVARMETSLEIYRGCVAKLPACDAEFFSEALARYRAGDERAARDISGRCLGLALRLGEERSHELGSTETLEAVQEANRRLWKSITTFAGNH